MPSYANPSSSLSAAAALRLKPLLDRFAERAPNQERIGFDPVEFPHRYRDPRDIEVSGLLAASLAYGRADLFRPKLDLLFSRIGSSPANFVAELSPRTAKTPLADFVYRFNVGTDLAESIGTRRRQATQSVFALDGPRAGSGGFRDLVAGSEILAGHPTGHPRRPHCAAPSPHQTKRPQLENRRGDHGFAQANRCFRSSTLRLRALPLWNERWVSPHPSS